MKVLIPFLFLLTCITANAQKSYSIVFLNKNPEADKISPEQSKSIMEGHMSNMERLSKEGKLLIAGPFDGGGGIFVMNSSSEKEINEWIGADPGIQAQRWRVEILPFHPRYGAVCPVGEKYEMTHYTFIRFDAIVSKFTAANYPELMVRHNAYLQDIIETGNVVSEAIFSERDGGILILKGEVDPELVWNDPAVQEGLIETQQKKLYIAKGSFCEE